MTPEGSNQGTQWTIVVPIGHGDIGVAMRIDIASDAGEVVLPAFRRRWRANRSFPMCWWSSTGA